jgi:hypothetical protein
MISAKDFSFVSRPWKPAPNLTPSKGPRAREVLAMKVGDSKLVSKEKLDGMKNVAYRRCIPHRVEKQGNRWLFVRLG